MMFEIVSSAGVKMGAYEAETAAGALDAMAKDAGYGGHAAACEATGTRHDDWTTDPIAFRRDGIGLLVTEVLTLAVDGYAWTAPRSLWEQVSQVPADGSLRYEHRVALGFAKGIGACKEPPSGDVSDRLRSYLAWRDGAQIVG